ncbi:MAG: fatty acid desaturase [Alphaproteobacteria bacterium]
MDDFIGVRGVIEPRRLKELSERSDLRGAVQAASHVGAIGANSYLLSLAWGSWWAVPLFFLQGMLLGHLYAALHECDHNTAFRSRWANQWLGRVFGFVILFPSDAHKWLHFTHHRHTQDFERDTELLPRKPFANAWQFLWMFSAVTYYYHHVASIVGYAARHIPETAFTASQRKTLVIASRIHLAGYAAVAASAVWLQSWWPLTYWIAPMVVAKWTYYFQGLLEHTGLTQIQNTLENTRSFKTNPFMRWLHWNMVYHTAHHTFPSVPFFRLAELHREVEAKYPHPLPVVTYFGGTLALVRALFRASELELVAAEDAAYARRHGLASAAD